MILECPACHKRYLVDPRSLGNDGRTVRCANCKNQWFATPEWEMEEQKDDAEDIFPSMPDFGEEVEAKPIPKGSSVPAVIDKSKTPLQVKLSCVALLLLTLAVSVVYFRPAMVHAMPGLQGMYDLMGMQNTEGLVLADLSYDRKAVGLNDLHHISGVLVNTSDEVRQLPMLSVRLLGKGGTVIRKGKIPMTELDAVKVKALKPGGRVPFQFRDKTSPDSVENIIVEIGNGLELKLRK